MFPARPLVLCHQPARCLVTAIRNQLIGNSKIWSHTIQEIWTMVKRWQDRRRWVAEYQRDNSYKREADVTLKLAKLANLLKNYKNYAENFAVHFFSPKVCLNLLEHKFIYDYGLFSFLPDGCCNTKLSYRKSVLALCKCNRSFSNACYLKIKIIYPNNPAVWGVVYLEKRRTEFRSCWT